MKYMTGKCTTMAQGQRSRTIWKANLIQAIVIAVNDSDRQPWIDWVKEAIDDPDPDKLMDSGDPRFHSIDAKLGSVRPGLRAREIGNVIGLCLRHLAVDFLVIDRRGDHVGNS